MGLTLTAALLALGGSVAPAYATGSSPTLYVVNAGSGSVTPVDLATDSAGTPIPVGTNPLAVAITPDGRTAYVSSCVGNTVTPINVATNSPGSAIAVGSCPSVIAITPDGRTAYVANEGSNSVTPIVTATNTAGAAIAVGANPEGIAITPDGTTAYVANEGTNTVTPINTATNTAGTAITVGSDPGRIAITPDGRTAYVTNEVGDSVTPISTATNVAGTAIAVGSTPIGIAITPDGRTAYVAVLGTNSVTPINTATNTAGADIAVGSNPVAIAIAPDGKTAYVANESSNTVEPIDTATGTSGTAISVGSDPAAIAIAPDQAPVAALTITSAPAFQTTVLDASASSVAFGSIASYAWDFGDGHTATTATPTTDHVYQNVGVYAATVTETDSAGTSKTQVFTGQTMSRNGGSHASVAATVLIPHGPPGAPTGVSASGGDRQATVTFTAPRDDGFGDPISSYTVTASPGGASASGSASPITVTGLTDGTTYTFTVTATNGVGTGPASTASNSVTPVGLADAPTEVSAAAGDGTATVSFTAPADNGSPISSYTVTASPGGQTATGPSSPITVTGLTDGTTYTFTVTATNGVGTGAASTASNSVTPVGPADGGRSTLAPLSSTLIASGSSTRALTVRAKDAEGNDLSVGGATVTITKRSGVGTIGPVTDNGNGTYTATVTAPSSPGTGVFVATLNGSPVESGSGSQTLATIHFVPQPTIAGFTPNNGGIHATVTLTGTNLTGITTVRLNGTSAVFSVISDTELTFTIPDGATSGTITVTNPGATATSAGRFTVASQPTITSISPGSGPIGTSVTVTGTNLQDAVGVEIGGVVTVPTSVAFDGSQLTFTVPPGATSGTVRVLARNGSATSADPFTVTG